MGAVWNLGWPPLFSGILLRCRAENWDSGQSDAFQTAGNKVSEDTIENSFFDWSSVKCKHDTGSCGWGFSTSMLHHGGGYTCNSGGAETEKLLHMLRFCILLVDFRYTISCNTTDT